ncbi:MAG: cytochrome c oxidase subunit II [Myxococcota bacterium]
MESLVVEASSYAKDIDDLIMLILVLAGFWFLLAEAVFFGFIFRFRAKEGQKAQYITGEEKQQKKWISIPHALVLVCDIFIIVGAVKVWVNVKQTLPEAAHTVRVIGQQWAWTFVHPGPDGQLDTPDDITTNDELHVKVNAVYHFKLESRDVLHSFSVPAFRLKQDAVPGRTITGWFEPTRVGAYDVQCAEICGIGHGIMAARLMVETPEQHDAWMKRLAPPPPPPVAAPTPPNTNTPDASVPGNTPTPEGQP